MPDHIAADIRQLVDQHCDQFEAAWNCGERPQIHDLLEAVPAEARAELCGELVALEMELRVRAGDVPDLESYRQEFPEYADTVERTFEEFHTWVRTTAAVDESVRSRVMSVEQDTEPQALETKHWPNDAEPVAAPDELSASAEAESGRTLGRYEVVRKLGQGGMGSVLLARDPVLDRLVALKLPHFQADDGPQVIERFYREARAMAAVHHPNLCPIFDVGDADGHPFLAMAFIDGRSLAETIQSGQPLDAGKAVRLVRTTALAVQAIHEAGVVHRDLKPSNVMIDGRGQPMVTDFGLATRARPDDAELTRSGAVVGSPAYMAPEQVRSQVDQIGPRTDVYALGVMLYQLLCGRRPFEGTAASVFGKIESGARPKPLTETANVDRRLQTVCLKAMTHNVDDRYTSAAEFAAALEPFALDRASRSVRGGPRVVAAPAIAVSLLLAIALYLWWKKPEIAQVDDSSTSSVAAKSVPANQVIREEPKPPRAPMAIAPFTEDEAEQYQEAWAESLGASVEHENSLGMKLRLIPPGEFLMGAPDDDPEAKVHEKPQHRVRLTRPFWIGTTEVTTEQFAVFINDTGYVTEAQADGQGAYAVGNGRLPALTWDRRKDHAANPVQCVSWTDARKFCDWLSEKEGREYRLPTEAEWEFTCRAGTNERYYFGNEFDVNLANSGRTEDRQLAPVAQYRANAFGLYDMHGNVHEICLDAGRAYTAETVVDPVGSLAPEDCAVVRGGAISSPPSSLRSSQRYLTDSRLGPGQSFATEVKGFRVVLLPDDDQVARAKRTPETQTAATTSDNTPVTAFGFWSAPENLGPKVNSINVDDSPTFTDDGRTVIFHRPAPPASLYQLWSASRSSDAGEFETPAPMDSEGNISSTDTNPRISSDGLTLVFDSDREGGQGHADLWFVTRSSVDSSWSQAVNFGAVVNSGWSDMCPCLSDDGLTLLFSSDRAGGSGLHDIWMATRPTVQAEFSSPQNLGPRINGGGSGGSVVYPSGTVSIVNTTVSTNTGTSTGGIVAQLNHDLTVPRCHRWTCPCSWTPSC